MMQAAQGEAAGARFDTRYQVNLLVDNAEAEGAPVVGEELPTYANLVGRVEHMPRFGALVTDFTMIKPGALHRANGGFLLLDARTLLLQPMAWEGLKRALRMGEVKIESVGQMLSLISTVSLEPEPIPLDVTVVLIGEPMIYYLLAGLDPDFPGLFKVPVDFGEDMEWSEETLGAYARLIATRARRLELLPLEAPAVARVIERAARLAEDSRRLSLHGAVLSDLLREADHWARRRRGSGIAEEDVRQAHEARIFRADRIRERAYDLIRRGVVLIDLEGERVGQINGLAVSQLGGFAFARPSRITARVRVGPGKLVDIEREVEMAGPIHSKGVLILQGFLAGRYAMDRPLSLSASLVFEQSYSGVEGDSASSAELYALLSALAGVPIRQSFAVTGSVNQHGDVQAIGGVNEKIEGFFDVWRQSGGRGEPGVLIPAANVQHLMLRDDVVEAGREGRFRIYAVSTIDQGITLLTGMPAGERDAEGRFPEGSINARIEARLIEHARAAQAYAGGAGTGERET